MDGVTGLPARPAAQWGCCEGWVQSRARVRPRPRPPRTQRDGRRDARHLDIVHLLQVLADLCLGVLRVHAKEKVVVGQLGRHAAHQRQQHRGQVGGGRAAHGGAAGGRRRAASRPAVLRPQQQQQQCNAPAPGRRSLVARRGGSGGLAGSFAETNRHGRMDQNGPPRRSPWSPTMDIIEAASRAPALAISWGTIAQFVGKG